MTSGSNTSNEPKDRHGTLSTSRSLLVALREDDNDAWARMVELYSPLVCYWCRRLNAPEQDVADILQEVFRAVANNIVKFKKEQPKDSYRGWLRTITRSKVMDLFRRRSKEAQATGGTDAQIKFSHLVDSMVVENEQDEDNDDANERNLLYQRALQIVQSSFHERTWQAFWKVAVEDRPVKDVAEELDMKPGTVRVSRSRVLARLRAEFGDLLLNDDATQT